MKFILIAALALAAYGQEAKPVDPPKPAAPKSEKLTELETEKFLRMNAQIQVIQGEAQKQIEKLGSDRDTLAKSVCERVKLELNNCLIDPQTATVSEKPKATPAK